MTRFVSVLVVAVLMSASASASAAPPAGAHGSESPGARQAQASSTDQAPPSQGSAGKSARAPAGAPAGTDAVTPGISCPGDAVVWVNLRSRGYHMQGDKFFGHTRRGKFMCRKAADAAGDHAIKPGSR